MRKLIATLALPLAIGVAMAGPANAAPAPTDTVTTVGQVDPIARHTATVKCQLIGPGGEALGYITGNGSGKTKPAAVADAKKDADRNVPQGHYKRHCKEI
ncbi:hypothetical protein [Nocardia sp. NPDC052316]|uniref:hypothetical protein n=1 Tax=Nocardia sp. NPDC052316 TaxID=3364329 RepID=UPI0037CC3686